MIAIYDEKIITGKDYEIWAEFRKESKYDIEYQSIAGRRTVASFNTEPQAQYVLGQIALAIEQGKTLFRMPSVKRVQKLIDKDCDICVNKMCSLPPSFRVGEKIKSYCDVCGDKYYWQPKE